METLRAAYLPLENIGDELSPIRVLHEGFTLGGIADMAPMLPHWSNLPHLPNLSNLQYSKHARLKDVAQQLLRHDETMEMTGVD